MSRHDDITLGIIHLLGCQQTSTRCCICTHGNGCHHQEPCESYQQGALSPHLCLRKIQGYDGIQEWDALSTASSYLYSKLEYQLAVWAREVTFAISIFHPLAWRLSLPQGQLVGMSCWLLFVCNLQLLTVLDPILNTF